MYAFVLHAHQMLDRAAHRQLRQLPGELPPFPAIRQILHFEGRNGPDASKLKRVTDAQPWHFVDPFNADDTDLARQIESHHDELAKALRTNDMVRSAFEAAWLAHALVDGLTPAHHYPYEQELERLRGQNRDTRKGLLGRLYVQGDNLTQSLIKSFKLVGPKGLLTTHALFEGGSAAIILPLRFGGARPTPEDMALLQSQGITAVFNQLAREIADLNIYGRFYVSGWTPTLARDIRRQLAPRMIRAITLAWYSARQAAA